MTVQPVDKVDEKDLLDKITDLTKRVCQIEKVIQLVQDLTHNFSKRRTNRGDICLRRLDHNDHVPNYTIKSCLPDYAS
jgi:hypothetical protein